MEELFGNKMEQLLENFTSMERNFSSLCTELNNVKEEVKTYTEKNK